MDIITMDSLMQEKAMQELMQFLQLYQRNQESKDMFELVSYIESLETKLDQALGELSGIKGQLNELQKARVKKPIREVLETKYTQIKGSCENMKQRIFDIKQEVKDKAADIVQGIKEKGESALHRMSEFLGIREKLAGVKKLSEKNMESADHAINVIQSSGRHIRQAANHARNAARVITGKDEVTPKELRKSSPDNVVSAPWRASRAVYASINIRVDACVGKLDQLAERAAKSRGEKEGIYQAPGLQHVSAEMVVAENNVYNSEAFELFMGSNDKIIEDRPLVNPEVSVGANKQNR